MSERADHDAVVCFCIAYIPLVPLHARHMFDWVGDACGVVAIRMTRGLIVRAMLRTWVIGLLALAILGTVVTGVALVFRNELGAEVPESIWTYFWTCAAVMSGALVLIWLTRRAERRQRDIRLVLGPHVYGSSDPAYWTPDAVRQLEAVSPFAGGNLDEPLARRLLREGKFVEAMWLARLGVGKGMPWGEDLTDTILNDLSVLERLDRIRRRPWLREDVFGRITGWWPQAPPMIIHVNRKGPQPIG